jgi:hypothetical protein
MQLSWNEIRDRALRFSREWADETSEDAEAKSFWDAFFDVFGVTRRRLASFEQPVKKADGKGGFIDLLWKGILLVEHKSRGRDLDRAFKQATDYFPGLKERDLPRYVLVSDFARFRLFDLDSGEQHEFALQDLHRHVALFGFIAGYQVRAFKDQDPANIDAAVRMGALHDALKNSGYEGHALEVLLVRLLFCLFAEDTGIFERRQFQDFIEQRTSDDGSDLGARLAALFHALDTPRDKRQKLLDEHVAAFEYVNGNLFRETLPPAAFDRTLREALLNAAGMDWSRISPAIFGSLFQSIMDAKARRNVGAHYTSEKNILKLIGPLFMDGLRAEFDKIKGNRAKLHDFHEKIAALKFLDPACGCGNFLVIAYRELRLLEHDILDILYRKDLASRQVLDPRQLIQCNVDQFYGIEIEEFPAQIAQVAMWLTDHQMNLRVQEAFGNRFVRLPLVTSATIVNGNALRIDWSDVVPAAELNYILGNPPFIGHHLQTAEQKADMLAAIGDAKAAGVLDFVSAWYALAARMIEGTAISVAFVSTNSITQGEQVGILWRALSAHRNLRINFAHQTFRWSNEAKGNAAVYCVIIGFSNRDAATKTIYEYENVNGEPHATVVTQINAYLVNAPWVLLENRNVSMCGMPEMMYGSKPTDDGNFLFTDVEKQAFLREEPGARPYIKPFISAHEFLHGEKRWVLWLVGAEPAALKALPAVLERVDAVRRFRKASKAASTRDYPYPSLFRQVTQPKSDYVLIPGHTSESRNYIPFGFFSKDDIVGNSCFALPTSSLFHFGVLTSAMHMAWVRYTCGRIKSDFRYSKDIVYNNFPWPDRPPSQPSPASGGRGKSVEAIEQAAQAVLDTRTRFPDATLADLYDPLTMPPALVNAHHALDRAVDAAYGKRMLKTDAERVAFLFERYQQMTSLLPEAKARPARQRKSAPAP